MRVSSKLLLSYAIMIALIGLLLSILLPGVVSRKLVAENVNTLSEQAIVVANHIGRYNLDSASGISDLHGQLTPVVELLTTVRLVVVDARGIVVAIDTPNGKHTGLLGISLQKPFRRTELISDALAGRPTTHVDKLPGLLLARLFRSKAATPEIPLVVASVPIRNAQDKVVGAVVAIEPVSEVAAISKSVVRSIVVWIAAALLVGMIASGLVSQDLVQRLRRLGRAARTMAEGDLSVRVSLSGHDEVAELGTHFNHMAERNEALVDGLKKSETLRRELVASVSHELRTPITSIQGFAEALHDGVVTDPEQSARYLAIIAEESGRLARLIDDLFEVSKLEAGQGEFRFVTLQVAPWLEKFAERTRPRLEAAGLRVRVHLPAAAADVQVLADPGRLDQVLNNLVNNAARFAPQGSAIEVLGQPEASGRLRIAVHNDGPPISPEDQSRLFDRFYQGKQGRPHKGAGLGLAVVKGIIDAHGGKVGVQSAAGEGTTFWFTLRGAS